MAKWRLQIYLVSDETSQQLIAALLAGIDNLVVETVGSDFDSFVIVESPGHRDADEVFRLIHAIDPGARLIHTTTARPAEQTAV